MGPGAYGGSKFKHLRDNSPKKDAQPPILAPSIQPHAPQLFGSEGRFRGPRIENPGPGSYADVNRWHKKTYNLKFLNVA